MDVFYVLLHGRTELLLVGGVLHRDAVEHGLQVTGYVAVVAVTSAGKPVVIGLSLAITTESRTTLESGSLLAQAIGLLLGALGKVVVIASEHTGSRGEDAGCLQVEAGVARGEGPHVVGRSAALTVSRHLVGFQTRVVVQSVGDAGGIAKVVVVVEDGVRER